MQRWYKKVLYHTGYTIGWIGGFFHALFTTHDDKNQIELTKESYSNIPVFTQVKKDET